MKNFIVGISYSFLYVVSCAVALIIIQMLSFSCPSVLILWLSTLIATVILHLGSLKKIQVIYSRSFKNLFKLLLINVSVFFIVCSSYISVGIIGTERYLILYFSVVGCITGTSIFKAKGLLKDLLSVIIYFISFLLIIVKINVFCITNILIISLTILGGVGGMLYAKHSQKLFKSTNLKALEILSIRYWLVIFVLPFLFKWSYFSSSIFSSINLFYIAISAIGALIFPLFFSQKSLEYVDYKVFLIISSSTPFMAVIFSSILNTKVYNNIETVLASFFVMLASVILQVKNIE